MSGSKPVILVMHSYEGVVGTNAVHSLEAATRRGKAEKGGIIHCLFIAASLLPQAESLTEMFDKQPPYIHLDVSDSKIAYIYRRHILKHGLTLTD